MRRRTNDDWRAVVYRHPDVSNGTRVLLLYLADRMREDGTVSVPRSVLAEVLGVTPRRILERVQEAHTLGLLDTVVRAKPRTTAVYARMFPSRPVERSRRAMDDAAVGRVRRAREERRGRPVPSDAKETDTAPPRGAHLRPSPERLGGAEVPHPSSYVEPGQEVLPTSRSEDDNATDAMTEPVVSPSVAEEHEENREDDEALTGPELIAAVVREMSVVEAAERRAVEGWSG